MSERFLLVRKEEPGEARRRIIDYFAVHRRDVPLDATEGLTIKRKPRGERNRIGTRSHFKVIFLFSVNREENTFLQWRIMVLGPLDYSGSVVFLSHRMGF